MPLPKDLHELLTEAEPEMVELTTDQRFQLEAYLAHPDGHGVLLSQLAREADYGGSKYREIVGRHNSFHRFLRIVRDYNRLHSANSSTAAMASAKPRIGSWSELAIGLDESFTPLAYIPPPTFGAPVLKTSGVQLILSGRRWRAVFELASEATDGRTISKSDLLTKLKPAGKVTNARSTMRQGHAGSDELRPVNAGDSKYFSDTLADLRRELRKVVNGPDNGSATLLRDAGADIDLGFVVRALVRDEDRRYTFGTSV